MPLGVRIFLVYFLFVGLAGWFVLSTVMDEIRPGVRQSTEETLVDTANLLAEILRDEVKSGQLAQGRLPELLKAYGLRQPQAQIWGVEKSAVSHRIYVTDARGIVLLDSSGVAVGQDYSRWNDVYLTLQGQYGARSTREDPADEDSSVMYVAAPIKDGEQIIGVVSVAKPNQSLQPYIERSQRRLGWLGAGLIVLGLLIGGVLSWWLSGSLRKLTRYAQAVSQGQRAELPALRGGELTQLAQAVQKMRTELEGKAYVEQYVHTLTHELKSPLAAIRGAAELLEGEMPAEQRQRFVANIASEGARLQQLIERLLNLALVEQRQGLEERVAVDLHALAAIRGAAELLEGDMPAEQRQRFVANIASEGARLQQLIERLLNLALVEQRQGLEERVAVDLHALAEELLQAQAARVQAAGLRVANLIPAGLAVPGERFLLRQALANLLDNALDFTPPGGELRFTAEAEEGRVELALFNQGEAIPDYALPRLTERFYSLPRPASGRKSTGLGLNFVQEVALLHGGELTLRNLPGGVRASLRLPLA